MAQGDKPGQQLKIKVLGTLPGSAPESSWIRPLSTAWADYSVALPAGVHPSKIDAVQFVLGDGLNQGNGTVYLDQVRLGVDGFDRLRLPQSYRPAGWVSDNPEPAPGTIQERDLKIYPARTYLYDQALAIKALVTAGVLQTAHDVADAIIATGTDDGSYFNERSAGHVLNGDGTPRDPLSALRTLGDNAWLGLALIDLFRVTGDVSYLNHAVAISDWAEQNLKDQGPLGGYRGGFDVDGNAVDWRSVEHNIDAGQLNFLLAAELEKQGESDANVYRARGQHAWDFVVAMFDDTEGKFWAGTSTGDTVNTVSVPLDTQLWSLLTLAESQQYASSIDWKRPLVWTETHLQTSEDSYSGFTFSTGSTNAISGTNGIVWFEGTAHAAVAYYALGEAMKYTDVMDGLSLARPRISTATEWGLSPQAVTNLETQHSRTSSLTRDCLCPQVPGTITGSEVSTRLHRLMLILQQPSWCIRCPAQRRIRTCITLTFVGLTSARQPRVSTRRRLTGMISPSIRRTMCWQLRTSRFLAMESFGITILTR